MANSSSASTGFNRHFTRARVLGFIVIVALWLLLESGQKEPTPAATGDAFNGPAATSQPVRPTLRVATFNIDGGVGTDEKLDLQRTADCLKGFDLVGLEEVHGRGWLENRDQAHILGDLLNEPYLYAAAETQWWHESFGNAALSALPVTFWQRFPFSNAGAEHNRALLLFGAKWGARDIGVIVVHLVRHQDHLAELKSAKALFLAMQAPAILMGDMNPTDDDASTDPPLHELRTMPDVVDAIGPHLGTRTKNLDWIFARGLECVDGGFVEKGASDHPVAWAEFK